MCIDMLASPYTHLLNSCCHNIEPKTDSKSHSSLGSIEPPELEEASFL